MPIGGAIPMPGNFGDAFMRGATGVNTILDSMLARKLQEQSQADLAKYRQSDIGLRQQAEGRAQAQLPYLLQKYKDAHQEAITLLPLYKQQYQDVHKKALSEQEERQAYNEFMKSRLEAAKAELAGGGNAPAQGMATPGMAEPPTPQPQQSFQPQMTPVGMPALPNVAGFAAPNMTPMGQSAPVPQGTLPGMTPPMAPPMTPNLGQQAPIPENKQMPAGTQNPGEQVIRKGDSWRRGENALAGMKLAGHEFPDVKTTYDKTNGVILREYPDKTVTIQPYIEPGKNTNETPEHKEERMVETATRIAKEKDKLTEDKENRKELLKLDDSIGELSRRAALIKEAKDILRRNKDLTGPQNLIGTKTKIANNPDLGRLQVIFGALQGMVAQDVTKGRTGVGSLGWAKEVKPDILSRQSYNEGMLNQLINNLNNDYGLLNNRYKKYSKNGQGSEIKLPEFDKGMSVVQDPDTKEEYEVPDENLDQLLKDYPNLKKVR